MVLNIYWQLRRQRRLLILEPDDTDELISQMALETVRVIDQWEPSKGALSTFVYQWAAGRLKHYSAHIAEESGRYETGVFGETSEDSEDESYVGEVAKTEGLNTLPINDLVYAESPLGMLRPEESVLLDEQVQALELLKQGKINPRQYLTMLRLPVTDSALRAVRIRRKQLIA